MIVAYVNQHTLHFESFLHTRVHQREKTVNIVYVNSMLISLGTM